MCHPLHDKASWDQTWWTPLLSMDSSTSLVQVCDPSSVSSGSRAKQLSRRKNRSALHPGEQLPDPSPTLPAPFGG